MSVTISPATAGEWAAAGRMMFADAPDPGGVTARYLEMIAAGDINPAGLFVARDRGELCGAMLAQPFGGGQGSVWPPSVSDRPDREAVEDRLSAVALSWLRAGGAKVVQSLLEPGDPGGPSLERAGFALVTTLAFLSRDIEEKDKPENGFVHMPPEIELLSPANAAAFTGVLLASYEGTLDCPELNDVRSAGEILTGYRETSPSDDREWFLACRGGRPAAVLMLAAPNRGPWALVYLGIAPGDRGAGLGRELTRFAVRRAAAAGAPGITLNVDLRNTPALRLYAGEGFTEYARRTAFLAIGPKFSQVS